MNAGLSKSHSANLSKQLRVMTGIVTDGSLFRQIGGRKPRSHTLSGTAYSIPVQAIAACAHDTTHAGGTKLQIAAEAAFQFIFIIGDGSQLLPSFLRESGVAPEGVTVHVIHCIILHSTLEKTAQKKGSFELFSSICD
jgi:hypothetical protein